MTEDWGQIYEVHYQVQHNKCILISYYPRLRCKYSHYIMLDSSNGIKHKKHYLHLWNNLPQNAVQTSSPLWRAQRPEDSTQTQEKAVLMCLFTSTTGSSQNAADVYGIWHWYWQHPLSPCKLCSICRLACCIRRRWAPPRTGTAVSGCLR